MNRRGIHRKDRSVSVSNREPDDHFFRAIVEASPTAILMVDAEGAIKLANSRSEELFGYAPAELLGQKIEILVPDRYRVSHREYRDGFLQNASARPLGAGCDLYCLRADRSEVAVEIGLSPINTNEGTFVLASIIDITERKRREEESLLQTRALDCAANGIVITDRDGKIVWVNRAFSGSTGYAPEEVAGQNPRFLKSGEHGDDFYREMWATILTGQIWHGVIINRKKDGSLIHEDMTITPIQNGSQEITHFIAIKKDITERIRDQHALRESEERLQTVIENLVEGLVISELDGRLVHWNRAAIEMNGFTSLEECLRRLPEFERIFEFRTLNGEKLSFEDWPLSRIIRGESLRNLELSVRRLDTGLDRIFSYGGQIVREPSGKQLAFITISDVTERCHAEHALRASEAEMRALFASMTDVILVFDREGRHLKVAPTKTQKLVQPAEARIGKTIHEVYPENKADFLLAQVRTAFEKGDIHRVEYDLEIGGEQVWFEASVSPMTEDTVVWVARDITERKRLEEQRELLSALVQASPDFIGYADAKTAQILYINKHGRSMCGIGEDEELGELKIGDVHPAWMNQRMEKVILPAAVRDGVWEGDGAFLKRDGSEIPVSMLLLAHKTSNEEVDLFYTVSRDITERKKAEEALRESEERYRDLVENAHDIIYSHDLEGRYTSMNKAGETITGYTVAEALQMSMADTVALEDQPKVLEMMRRKLAGEKATAYEIEIIAKDGRRIPLEVNTKYVYQHGVPVGVQGIARDVTERRHLEEQLRQSQKMEAIGQLAGGVAHDFNNLLTAINGYSALALQRIDPNSSIKTYLEEIKKAGDRAANLTRQLLAFWPQANPATGGSRSKQRRLRFEQDAAPADRRGHRPDREAGSRFEKDQGRSRTGRTGFDKSGS